MLTKMQKIIIKETEEYVYQLLKDDPSGHDWWHIQRVRNLAKNIAEKEQGTIDLFVCEMAALLHDVADGKLNKTEAEGEKKVRNWLSRYSLTGKEKEEILKIILHMSYKGGTNKVVLSSIEGKIVQDADRLDAIGAIGIARTMAYSGSKNRLIHDPAKVARENLTIEEYRSGEDTAIMHFYEKLLKLKEGMNTTIGKQLAEKRHAYMENYLTEFYAEWDGER
ncbi:HD domain protein [Carnobacterium sp. AT7]|uniref:HD domain-containing protein n=1 Tax=Carnobacterium TaxID=2747 RepID=UPI00015F2B2E|nr:MULTISPECIES: HD domain-containing protein [Carnobacterium]EDP67995.1 HD domain protein [Carnobacterium sp. AT7]